MAEVVEVLAAAGLGKEVGTVLGVGTVHEDELVILDIVADFEEADVEVARPSGSGRVVGGEDSCEIVTVHVDHGIRFEKRGAEEGEHLGDEFSKPYGFIRCECSGDGLAVVAGRRCEGLQLRLPADEATQKEEAVAARGFPRRLVVGGEVSVHHAYGSVETLIGRGRGLPDDCDEAREVFEVLAWSASGLGIEELRAAMAVHVSQKMEKTLDARASGRGHVSGGSGGLVGEVGTARYRRKNEDADDAAVVLSDVDFHGG